MSTQVNLRFDDDIIAALDDLAATSGSSRAEVVREAVNRQIAEAAAQRAADAYRHAYAEHPETVYELERAQRSADRLTDDETWEPWW